MRGKQQPNTVLKTGLISHCAITGTRVGAFDRIVSVGMLEHVGPADVPACFQTVRRLLAPGGVAVIHSIAVHD